MDFMLKYIKYKEHEMKIGIIGLGLIGGTIAKSLKKNHYISAYDISKEALDYALKENVIQKSYNKIDEFLKENSVIYICLYPGAILDFFNRYENLIEDETLFIDISGVKKYLIKKYKKNGHKNYDVVFSHPVAGSEKVGVKFSSAKIFENANYVITPVDSNKEKNLLLVESLAKEMGFANISTISPEEHDDIISYTSQLTHIISLSLVNSLDSKLDTNKFTGDSYKDLTRIANINEKLWSELFLANKSHLLNKIHAFRKQIEEFEEAINKNDEKKLMNLMKKASKIKQNMQ